MGGFARDLIGPMGLVAGTLLFLLDNDVAKRVYWHEGCTELFELDQLPCVLRPRFPAEFRVVVCFYACRGEGGGAPERDAFLAYSTDILGLLNT